jgi:hypothetical protein
METPSILQERCCLTDAVPLCFYLSLTQMCVLVASCSTVSRISQMETTLRRTPLMFSDRSVRD